MVDSPEIIQAYLRLRRSPDSSLEGQTRLPDVDLMLLLAI